MLPFLQHRSSLQGVAEHSCSCRMAVALVSQSHIVGNSKQASQDVKNFTCTPADCCATANGEMGGASTAASAGMGAGTMSLAFASDSTSALSGTTSQSSPTSSSATAVTLQGVSYRLKH